MVVKHLIKKYCLLPRCSHYFVQPMHILYEQTASFGHFKNSTCRSISVTKHSGIFKMLKVKTACISDFKRSNSVYSLLMMHTIYRKADEAKYERNALNCMYRGVCYDSKLHNSMQMLLCQRSFNADGLCVLFLIFFFWYITLSLYNTFILFSLSPTR